jgi:pimeloyl-ACP methyl ester carboxylesterase
MSLRLTFAVAGIALLSTSAHAQIRTGTVNVGDATLRYELSGRGETVVFVHGWANTLAIWDDQVPAFRERYQVLRYDRRGFGRSTGFADVSADPDDLRILFDSLGIASAYIVGLSAGSDVATRFAFTFPRRTLALVRLSGPPPEGMPGLPARGQENRATMAAILRTYGMDSLHKFVLSQVGYVPPDETDAERQRRLDRQNQGWDYTGRDILDPKPQSGRVPAVPWARIREITTPTLLVNGVHDNPRPLMAADSLARYLPNAKKVLIPRAGHAANITAPTQFNTVLLDFFASLGARQARSGVVNVGGAQLQYEVAGTGKPVVFIHGWAQDLRIWDDQVAKFSPSFLVVRYDKRGFGESTGHADITEDPNDLRILLDSLGIQSAHVVGLSRGARVALSFAVAFPNRVDGLVLYGLSPPEGFPMPARPGPLTSFREVALKHGLDSAGKAVFASPLMWLPPDEKGRAEAKKWFDAFWARYRGRDLFDPRPPSGRVPLARLDQLNGIRSPTLLLHGDHETPLGQMVADTAVRRIPNARKVVIPNAGHGAHFYDPPRFNAALMEFFRSVDRRQ